MTMIFKNINGTYIPLCAAAREFMSKQISGAEIELDVPKDKKRSNPQNRSIHKYCDMVSEAFNDAGLGMKVILSSKPEAEIPWDAAKIKEVIWRVVQKAMYGTTSTTQLTTSQVSKVYEVINREIVAEHGLTVPFPSLETIAE